METPVTSDNPVTYERSDGIARITLRRPPVNALSLEVIRAVVEALRRAAEDDDARVVVLASAIAKRFSAGLDLDILLGKSGAQIREFLQALYIDLYDAQYGLGKPSIAAVGGAARGGGMTMAVSCDVVLASESATFGYPEIDVGVIPAIHYAHLPRIVGRHRAFELLFTGRVFGATEARELGVVNRVVGDAQLEAETLKLAAQFCGKSAAVLRMGRPSCARSISTTGAALPAPSMISATSRPRMRRRKV